MTKQEKVFDILNKFEFFQGQRAGRELWNDKSKEVQDKDISDFIKDINYIRSYLQDSVVISREEQERILTATEKRIEELKNHIKELEKENFKLAVDNGVLKEEQEQLASDVCNYEMNLQHLTGELENKSKETAEKLLNDFKLWAREYQYKDTVVDENGERLMTNNEKLNYLYTYLCDKYKVEIKD